MLRERMRRLRNMLQAMEQQRIVVQHDRWGMTWTHVEMQTWAGSWVQISTEGFMGLPAVLNGQRMWRVIKGHVRHVLFW